MKYLKKFENFVPKQLIDREEKAVKMGLRLTAEDKISIQQFVDNWLIDQGVDFGMLEEDEQDRLADQFENDHTIEDFKLANMNSMKYDLAMQCAKNLIQGWVD